VTRLIREYPSAALLVLMGIGLLIAYLVARGRRLGLGDLLLFAVMAAFFDWLVFAIHGMWEQNSPFNLIVLVGLLFAVPVAAFFTLGVVLVALRIVQIALTGGSDAAASPSSSRKLQTPFLWMIAPVRWRGVTIAFVAFTIFISLKGIDCRCGSTVAGVMNALAMIAAVTGAIGLIGYIRWYSRRKRS
jgi:hypothetical protein